MTQEKHEPWMKPKGRTHAIYARVTQVKHAAFLAEAERQNRSVSNMCESIITDYLNKLQDSS